MKQSWLNSAVLIVALSACGPQAFVPNSVSSSQTPAGSMNIPPKVDIVLSTSSGGTIRNILPGINSEIPGFLEDLQNSGWDYRFVSISLSEYEDVKNSSITQKVSASRYDTNTDFNSWIAPFPGASYSDPFLKMASYLSANTFNVTSVDANTPVDARESGFSNQINFLKRTDVQRDFLRPDAVLAVVTLSNGDDRSDWRWGAPNTSDLGSPTISNAAYSEQLRLTKFNSNTNSLGILKYYSLVANRTTSCRGYGTWSGKRYEEMTSLVGGKSIDICTTPLSSALSAVAADLQVVKLSFTKRFLVVGTEPNVGTIKVTRYAGGIKANATTIPESSTNGWTYFGRPTGAEYAIESPIPMQNLKTGY